MVCPSRASNPFPACPPFSSLDGGFPRGLSLPAFKPTHTHHLTQCNPCSLGGSPCSQVDLHWARLAEPPHSSFLASVPSHPVPVSSANTPSIDQPTTPTLTRHHLEVDNASLRRRSDSSSTDNAHQSSCTDYVSRRHLEHSVFLFSRASLPVHSLLEHSAQSPFWHLRPHVHIASEPCYPVESNHSQVSGSPKLFIGIAFYRHLHFEPPT
ncbi:hypothetical protein B0I35DRAFT_122939 [Stachybotrys elegans]|uniref:Uncharacterized protein n=1 Tax=Stachybotrys elegans TaxID=80388 RepID=A0A8K0SXR9_9HYPO|nr:hypothetical protein B0I35DRAFT_122939 [Stachybotrys elegans]